MDFSVVTEIPSAHPGVQLSERNKKLLEVVLNQQPGTILKIGHESYREANRTCSFLRGRKIVVSLRRTDVYVEIP